MQNPLLSLINVTKIYTLPHKTIEALKGVTFDLYPSEILGLLGVNGAGKTTLFSLIASIHPPTSGEMIFKGASIYRDILAYRFNLGYCPQKPNFASSLTVEEVLYFAGKFFLLEEEVLEKQVRDTLQEFELEPYAACSPSVLSGGYQQRLLIARALMHNPSLVIFDEPTVGLDPHIRRQVWDLILKLKARGVSVILTTHYLDEAEYLADRVCILDQGVVKLIEKPEHLKNRYQQNSLEEVFLNLMQERNS